MQEEVTRGAVTLIVDGAKLSQQRREIKIKRYAHVIEGHIFDFKPKKHRRS